MPLNNPEGLNGVRAKLWPEPDVLYAALCRYEKMHKTLSRQLLALQKDFGLHISERLLRALRAGERPERTGARLVPSARRPLLHGQAAAEAVIALAGGGPVPGSGRGRGVRNIAQRLKNAGTPLSEHAIRRILYQYFPQGFDMRMPGRVRRQRIELVAAGPNDEWCIDGHEKLAHLALKLGRVSIEFVGYADKWSHYLIHLVAVPFCRDMDDAAHVLLDVIEQQGGVALTVLSDLGRELGWVKAILSHIRTVVAPHLPRDKVPPMKQLPSKYNTVIEGLWRWMRDDHGRDLRDCIEDVVARGLFDAELRLHRSLFYYVWITIAQQEANDFAAYWNLHVIRPQHGKRMPSGFSPTELYEYPEVKRGRDCLIPVPQTLVDHCRARLRPRSLFHLPDERGWLDDVYRSIGSPLMVPRKGWSVFWAMHREVERRSRARA